MPLLTTPTRRSPTYAYAYASDPEKGVQPARLARRVLARKGRWIAGTAVLICVLFYLSSSRPSRSPRPGTPGAGGLESQLEGIWDGEEEEPGWGWGIGLPFRKPPPSPVRPTDQSAFSQDDPDSINYIAPMHPDLSLLPEPSTLFAEVKLPGFLRPPTFEPFPNTRLREIISPAPVEEEGGTRELDKTSFAQMWKPQEVWGSGNDDRGEIRRVQWSGFAGGRDRWESEKQRELREERKEAVRRGFAHAWQAYKDHAWGNDEIRPISKIPSNPFNNWGASIIDTLDTLLLMGFSEEYNLCRPHINQLNMNWVLGRDWSQGYISEAPPTDDDETPTETWSVGRDKFTGLAVFETGIRYLGGMLGAYDLSGDQLLVDRATELAGILGRAFNTSSGLPAGRIDPGASPAIFHLGQVSLAEVGSMSLELIRLSQITGDRQWHDLAQRAMDYLERRVIPRGDQNPLIPMWFNPDSGLDVTLSGGYTLGGLSDSYYEYLIKTYKLLGGGSGAQQWKRIYTESVDKFKEILYVDIEIVPQRDILALGKYESKRLIPEIEHLTCFAGAMLGLGAKLLDRPSDMTDAERFTQSCYWLSAASKTGIQPEVVEFFGPDEEDLMWETVTQLGQKQHPDEPTTENTHVDLNRIQRWNVDGQPVNAKDGARDTREETYIKKLKGNPPGTVKVNGRGINRPETIESIFYMYRLTGDRKWQEKGWKMFVSWVTAAKVDGGMSSIQDVTSDNIRYTDNMESFMFAETLKYHFLLQSEPDVMSLDDYVLNTEAHPFIANPDLKSGSQRYWTPPPTSAEENLGVRGEGTHAQKWLRLSTIQKNHSTPPLRPGGGHGMGGGGGDPHYKPQAGAF